MQIIEPVVFEEIEVTPEELEICHLGVTKLMSFPPNWYGSDGSGAFGAVGKWAMACISTSKRTRIFLSATVV